MGERKGANECVSGERVQVSEGEGGCASESVRECGRGWGYKWELVGVREGEGVQGRVCKRTCE